MNGILVEIIGWIGTLGFATCGIPLAWHCYKQGNGVGQNKPFLLMWLLGELGTIIYVLATLPTAVLLVNYGINLICLLTVLRFTYLPRKSDV